jgi:acetyl-CoA/propionyl-CoA carboxylase biotin carboxyl carrier protein
MRGAKELGLRTIAVYSEIDRDALHVALADEAWNIGPAPAADSYLNIERIIEVAREAGAASVHPGYGFLAENPDFAQAVIDAGLTWVGPPPAAIALMGDKITSRRAADAAGVPSVPGTLDPLLTLDEVEAAADEYGFPLALKAAHGGGGKGLKVVATADQLQRAYESAQREADTYFGNAEVYLERYVERARHIEAQVLFDKHGNGAFLGERDCSIQRRHQKLVEETPATNFTEEDRAALRTAALAVGKAAGYENAGTVECLFTADDEIFFLEMNTRLQVEHTVTEMVTGIDLVHEQFRIAAGEPPSYDEGPPPQGHAIELRINAEDPARNFLPNPGKIVGYREPGGFGVRVDSGVVGGSAISQYYDNLIAKLVVWGHDREAAVARAVRALEEFEITGVSTTIPAHLVFLTHPGFIGGEHHTRFIDDEVDLSEVTHPTSPAVPEDEELAERELTVEVGGRRFGIRLWTPVLTEQPAGRQAPRRRPPKLGKDVLKNEDAGVITAPMQGTIVKINKKGGDTVRVGETLFVLEAMKMENEIKSPVDGTVIDLRVQAGDAVAVGAVIAVVR